MAIERSETSLIIVVRINPEILRFAQNDISSCLRRTINRCSARGASMFLVIAFDFHVCKRFNHLVESLKILAIARFISCREHDVGDCLGQLDVSDALPLRL